MGMSVSGRDRNKWQTWATRFAFGWFSVISFFNLEEKQLEIVQDPRTKGDILTRFAHSSSPAVQLAVAEHPNTPAHTLESLAQSPSEILRRTLLARLDVPLACLLVFMKDEHLDVRQRTWIRLEQRLTQHHWSTGTIFSSEAGFLLQSENQKARLLLLREMFTVPEIWKGFFHQSMQFQIQNFVLHESDQLVYPLTDTPFWFALGIYGATGQNAPEKNGTLQTDTQLALAQVSLGLEQLTIADAIVMHTFCDNLWKRKEQLLDEVIIQKERVEKLQREKRGVQRKITDQIEGELSALLVELAEKEEKLDQLDAQLKIFSAFSPLTRMIRMQDVGILVDADVGNPAGLAAIICALNARGLQRWLVNGFVERVLTNAGNLQTLVRLLQGMYAAADRQQDEQLRYQGFRLIIQTLHDFCSLARELGEAFHQELLALNQQPEIWKTLRAVLDGLGSVSILHRATGVEAWFQKEYVGFKQDNSEIWLSDLVKNGLGIRVVRPVMR